MINNKIKQATYFTVGILSLATIFAISNPNESFAATKEGKTYGDWKIVCEKNDTTKNEACFIQQGVTATEEKKQIPVATYQFAYADNKTDLKLIEILPQGILLQPGTSLIVGDKIIAAAKFTLCQNNGCIAVSDLTKDDLKTILTKESISVGMFNTEGKQANLPFSTKGLKDALDALKTAKY